MELRIEQNKNMDYSFQTRFAARGYRVYKNKREEAKCGDKVLICLEMDEKSIEIDPYCCSTKAMVDRHHQLIAVGHLLREI